MGVCVLELIEILATSDYHRVLITSDAHAGLILRSVHLRRWNRTLFFKQLYSSEQFEKDTGL